MKFLITLLITISSTVLMAQEKPKAKGSDKKVEFRRVDAKKAEAKPAPVAKKPEEQKQQPKSELEQYYAKPQLREPSKLRKTFEDSTKLVLGEYTLAPNSNIGCQDGKLGIVDYGDEIELILGARSLVVGIGKEKIEELDETCKTTFKSSYKGNVVEETMQEVCEEDGTETVKTVVTIEKEKISYTKTIDSDGKVVDEFTCVATYDKKQPVATNQESK